MKGLRGSITLDTSVFIEYFMGSTLGYLVKEYFKTLKPEERVYCSLYTVSEVFYVLCRLKGLEYAMEKVKTLLDSQVVEVVNTVEVALETGRLRCRRAISIGDCSCIATAKVTRTKALFARKEKELANEMGRRPFDVEIMFLSELATERP